MMDVLPVVERFANQRVLVVGDVMLDEYLSGDCSRISPEAPVAILSVSSSRKVLGGAANTANNIQALGGCAVLVGAVGDDEAADHLIGATRAAGIEFVPVRTRRSTTRKVRILGQHQQLLRLDYDEASGPDEPIESEILAHIRALLPACAIVVISDYAKGVVSGRLCQDLIALSHEAGKHVIIDPRPQNAAYYVGCDYLTPNWKESLGLIGVHDAPALPDVIDDVGRRVAERFHSHVLLTLGSKGIKFFSRDGRPEFEERALAKEVFDVSGAGDTMVATFALALAAGCDHREAAALGNRAAGIVVAKLGTATVSAAELLREERARTIVTRNELAGLAKRLRSGGLRIVTLNGSFDLMHAGHLHIIREARAQGDVLLVGVNSDRSVRANKGPDRPFVGEQERARMLLALRDVDYVHVFDEPDPIAFLDEVRPDVHVNGSEYGEHCIEAPTVRAYGGRIHIVHRLPGLSTSELVEAIRQRLLAPQGPS